MAVLLHGLPIIVAKKWRSCLNYPQHHPTSRKRQQDTATITRRKQIWQALHPVDAVPEWEKCEDEANSGTSDSTIPHRGPGRPKDFAASTAELTGQSKRHISRQVVIAEALGDDLQKVEGTSLDKGMALAALSHSARQ